MSTVTELSAREILDSRGQPTVEARCALESGAVATASVPSGRSTGGAEALELRDGDPLRYRGLGCRLASTNVNREIAAAVRGRSFATQRELDRLLVELDGTPNKARLGANALLAVSIAYARAEAVEAGEPLYERFAAIAREGHGAGGPQPAAAADRPAAPPSPAAARPAAVAPAAGLRGPSALPRLTINLFSGGRHTGDMEVTRRARPGRDEREPGDMEVTRRARPGRDEREPGDMEVTRRAAAPRAGEQMPAIQDVLIVPLAPASIDESLVMMYDIYQAAARLSFERYGMGLLTADEGGLAPPFPDTRTMIEAALSAIEASGYRPGEDVALAIDAASSHFYRDGVYAIDGRALDAAGMVELIAGWVERYPIVSVEDGLAEEDWEAWPQLRRAIGGRALVLGDDLLCTNPDRIRRAVESAACDALLLKVNQVGTLSEAAQSLWLARAAGWQVTVSVRSGETEDSWAADLAVGWEGDQFKNGSITQSERLAKYNRLLEIEQATGWAVRPWTRRH